MRASLRTWRLLAALTVLAACKKEQPDQTDVSGRALDAATGQPVPGALVELLQTQSQIIVQNGGNCGRWLDSARTDAAGRYQFRFDAQSGQLYDLRVSHPGFRFGPSVCDQHLLKEVKPHRKTVVDLSLYPVGFVRIRAVDDPTLTQYTGGIVPAASYMDGNRQFQQAFAFGSGAVGRVPASDTSAVRLYPGNVRQPLAWRPLDGQGVELPFVTQELFVPAHDTVEWLIRY